MCQNHQPCWSWKLIACIALMSGNLYAEDNKFIKITVTVNVVSEPCIINGNGPVTVDFGNDLVTTRLDGVNYLKNINYGLDCKDGTGRDLQMTILGSSASFDDTVLAADQPNLGIRIYNNGVLMPVNIPHVFDAEYPPELQVVPVKASGQSLNAGDFTAVAIMKVSYN